MTSKSFEDFLSVKWYDGLLVRSDHLMHADNRAFSLLAESFNMSVDQPGIIEIDAHAAAGLQLLEIGNIIRRKDGSGIELSFNITIPFRSVAPDGGIIIAIPNNRSYLEAPITEVKGAIKSPPSGLATYLVCIEQEKIDKLGVKKMYTPDRPIELAYPGLKIEIIEEESYKSNLLGDYRSITPVACVSVEGEKAEVDTSYIPPVVRLKWAEYFNKGLIDSLSKLFNELSDVSAQHLAAGGHVFSREGVGEELKTRYNFYHVLNALLLAKTGLFRNLPMLSPFRFFYELMYPLTKWFDLYYESLGARQSSIAPVADTSARIRALSHEDLSAGTGKLLELSRDFIHNINETIKIVA